MVSRNTVAGVTFETPEKVAQDLHCSRRKVLELCRAGVLPSIKVGKDVRVLSGWKEALVARDAVPELVRTAMNRRKQAPKPGRN